MLSSWNLGERGGKVYFKIGKEIEKFDNYILSVIKKYGQNRCLDIIMPIMTFTGNLGVIWIIISIVLILDKPYRVIGDSIILTLFISTILGEGIVKHTVRRVRPCNKQDYVSLLRLKPMSYSFPSGHKIGRAHV